MNEELGKELLLNDFPLETVREGKAVPGWELGDGSKVYVPTLSELLDTTSIISALYKKSGIHGWFAYAMDNGKEYTEHGKTPEEAVAKLWLALNKKQ